MPADIIERPATPRIEPVPRSRLAAVALGAQVVTSAEAGRCAATARDRPRVVATPMKLAPSDLIETATALDFELCPWTTRPRSCSAHGWSPPRKPGLRADAV